MTTGCFAETLAPHPAAVQFPLQQRAIDISDVEALRVEDLRIAEAA
ncbi:MAG: hypothetical protein ABI112_04835 [Terracoccus sp.]